MNFTECLIALSGACLLDPSNIQIEAGISQQISGDVNYWREGRNYKDGHVGFTALVLEQPLARGFAYRLGYEHRSVIEAGDRGEERWFVSLTWRPFR